MTLSRAEPSFFSLILQRPRLMNDREACERHKVRDTRVVVVKKHTHAHTLTNSMSHPNVVCMCLHLWWQQVLLENPLAQQLFGEYVNAHMHTQK